MSIPGSTMRAFPHNEKHADGEHWYSHSGMSLRDYFATAAMQGYIASYPGLVDPGKVARECYRYADAMLEERKK